MITQFSLFNERYDLSRLERGRSLAAWVWISCYSRPHIWMWTQQEKPGILTGIGHFCLSCSSTKVRAKDLQTPSWDTLVGCGAEARLWRGSHAWHCRHRGQGQHKASIPVGPFSPALVYRSIGSGSKGTCTELSSADAWPLLHDPASRGAFLSLLSPILGCEILAMRPPPSHCLWFLTTMGRCRNDHPSALEMTHGEHHHLCSCSCGEYFSVGKTPSLFVLCCGGLIPSFCVFSKLLFLPIISPLLSLLYWNGQGLGCGLFGVEFPARVKTSTCSNSTVRYQNFTASVNPKQSLDFYSK